MVEEAIKIEDSKFPTKLASGVLKEGVDTMLKRARGESMEEIVSKLEGEDKVIGERLFEECKKLEGYEDDPSFKFVETLKNSTSHKKKEKGKRVVYKCKGTLPFPLIDIVAFITNNNETKAYFDKMFVNEEYIRNIHPDIKIVHQSYKAKWPTKPRDFVMANWVHLTPLGQVKLIAASCEDPASPPDKEYIRGHIIVFIYIYIYYIYYIIYYSVQGGYLDLFQKMRLRLSIPLR